MTVRRHDWAERMFAVIELHRCAPFQYAQNDCSLFVARVIDAMTDSNYVQQLAEVYTDEATANALIATQGGLPATVSAFLGPPFTGRPQRGDVVGFDGGLGDAIGIWDGKQIVAMGETGLRSLARSEIKHVWRVT